MGFNSVFKGLITPRNIYLQQIDLWLQACCIAQIVLTRGRYLVQHYVDWLQDV
jgi:hypothetical protein